MNRKKQILRAYNLFVIALLAFGLIYACSRFVHLGRVEHTDNATVHRNLTPVNTRVAGFIKEIRFKEFEHVKRGDTLVVIDDAEFRLALAQAEAGVKGSRSGSGVVQASIGTTGSHLSAAQAGISAAQAGVSEARVAMDNARRDYDRFAALLKKGAVTQQQYDNVKTQYDAARSRYEGAQARQQQATASRQATAGVQTEQHQRLSQSQAGTSVAEAQLDLARLNLGYTVITAPCDGYVGRKDIYVGQLVQPGQLMVTVVDDADVWVTANYRESQLRHIAVGYAVEFEADALPGVTFKGVVESLSQATGQAYSHIPMDNSTGNFIKVEQRVPVRIRLTKDNQASDVARLKDGLMVECEVSYANQGKN